MSFLGSLFGKKEKPQKPVEPHIDTPWGPLYFNGIRYGRFEYEGMVDWYDDIDDPCDITIECDEDGVDDITSGLEKFMYIMEHKGDIDYQVKMAALDRFADESGLVMSENQRMLMSKDLFTETMPIICITIMRDGCIIFHIYYNDIYDVEDIDVTYTDKGTFEVSFEKFEYR